MFVHPDDLSQFSTSTTVDTFPVEQYYYIVDNSAGNHVLMVRINGSDL